jgi:hypothetical protein
VLEFKETGLLQVPGAIPRNDQAMRKGVWYEIERKYRSLSAHCKRGNPVRFMACKHRNVQVRWPLWQVRRYAARSELRSAAQFGYMGNPYVELGTMPAGGVC